MGFPLAGSCSSAAWLLISSRTMTYRTLRALNNCCYGGFGALSNVGRGIEGTTGRDDRRCEDTSRRKRVLDSRLFELTLRQQHGRDTADLTSNSSRENGDRRGNHLADGDALLLRFVWDGVGCHAVAADDLGRCLCYDASSCSWVLHDSFELLPVVKVALPEVAEPAYTRHPPTVTG